MIRAEGLRKSFGRRAVVDGLDLHVRPGETFGLLGPNGAGKSTTIHILVGILKPDAGRIAVAGHTDPTRPEARRQVGVAFQALSLYPDLTAGQNLLFFGRLYGLSGTELRRRVDWALELAGLTDRRSDRVRTFSGGMQRRLNVACALVHAPKVVFLDEPTVGVDPQSRNHLFDMIAALKTEGVTAVYTTHYMEEAQRLCDRVAIVDAGRVLAVDTVPGLIGRFGGTSLVEAAFDRPPVGATTDGNVLRVETDKPLEEVARLARAGGTLLTLNVRRPDLESVFLSLTGRSLRDR